MQLARRAERQRNQGADPEAGQGEAGHGGPGDGHRCHDQAAQDRQHGGADRKNHAAEPAHQNVGADAGDQDGGLVGGIAERGDGGAGEQHIVQVHGAPGAHGGVHHEGGQHHGAEHQNAAARQLAVRCRIRGRRQLGAPRVEAAHTHDGNDDGDDGAGDQGDAGIGRGAGHGRHQQGAGDGGAGVPGEEAGHHGNADPLLHEHALHGAGGVDDAQASAVDRERGDEGGQAHRGGDQRQGHGLEEQPHHQGHPAAPTHGEPIGQQRTTGRCEADQQHDERNDGVVDAVPGLEVGQ